MTIIPKTTAVAKPARRSRIGRPRRVLTSADLRTVERYAAKGCHEHTLARAIGVDGKTWTALKQRDPRLIESMEVGRAMEHDRLIARLDKAASKGAYIPDMFRLKARHGYIEGGAPESRPTVIINLPGAQPLAEYLTIESPEALPAPDAQPATKARRG